MRDERGSVALGGPKRRAVLAVLLLRANRPVRVDVLVQALWGDDAPPTGVKAVQVHISRLRNALRDPAILATTPAGYRLRVQPGELDRDRFETLAEEGRRQLTEGKPTKAAASLRKALEMWQGEALADLAFDPSISAEVALLEDQRLAALEARVEADLAAGRDAALVGELQRLVAAYPTRELFTGQLPSRPTGRRAPDSSKRSAWSQARASTACMRPSCVMSSLPSTGARRPVSRQKVP